MLLKEQGQFCKTFRGFRVFVYRYRAKNENGELVERLQNMSYPNLNFINIEQRASKFTQIHSANFWLGLGSILTFGQTNFLILNFCLKKNSNQKSNFGK